MCFSPRTSADLTTPWPTQTFALDASEIPDEHLDIWDLVASAQQSAFAAAHNGTVTADVDRVARDAIASGGYGRYFTHRLGHGESPRRILCEYARRVADAEL
jgi:hypothetical protein